MTSATHVVPLRPMAMKTYGSNCMVDPDAETRTSAMPTRGNRHSGARQDPATSSPWIGRLGSRAESPSRRHSPGGRESACRGRGGQWRPLDHAKPRMRTLRRLGLAICAAFALVRDARADAAAPAEPADHGIFTSVTEQDACTPGWTSQWDQILRYCVGEDAVAMVLGERELSPGEAHKARHSKSQSGHASKAQRPDHQRVPSFPGRIENLVTDNATGLLTFYVIDERNQPGARWAAWLRSEAPPPAGSARPPPHVAPNTAPPHVQTACYARDLGLDALFSAAPVLPTSRTAARVRVRLPRAGRGRVYALRVLAEYASCAVFAPRDRNQFLGAWHAPVSVARVGAGARRRRRARAASTSRAGALARNRLAPGADGGGTSRATLGVARRGVRVRARRAHGAAARPAGSAELQVTP